MADKRPSDVTMQRAAEWRMKLYAGDATADDWADFTDWLEMPADHAAAYDCVSESEAALANHLEHNAEILVEEEVEKSHWQPWAIAASLALVLITSLAFVPGLIRSSSDQIRFATGPAEISNIEIASGLNATLNGNTQLIRTAENSFEFDLTHGEVMFEIGPEHSSGIRLSVGTLTIIDRGTVFNVSKGTHTHRISVSEGSVELNFADQSYLLEAGQTGTFNFTDGSLQIEQIDPAMIGSWTEKRLEYIGTDIENVLLDASRLVGSRIDRGSCTTDAEFAGTIQLSGDPNEDVELLADLLGCTAQSSLEGWVLVN